jgi:AcrR family transcriptional regulator
MEILHTCLRCFAEKGFHQTSMRDLCGVLKLSPGALYRYFDSKEAIVEAFIEADRQKWQEIFSQITEATSFVEALETIHAVGSNEMDGPEGRLMISMWNQIAAEAMINEAVTERMHRHYETFTKKLEDLIRRSQKSGEISHEAAPRVLAMWVVASFDGLIIRYGFDPRMNWKTLSRQFKELILQSLGIMPLSIKRKNKRSQKR